MGEIVLWIFEKENKTIKLYYSDNILQLVFSSKQMRPNIELRGLSFCLDCPCGAAMWRGCNVLAIAPAKNAKQNKKNWVAIRGVK